MMAPWTGDAGWQPVALGVDIPPGTAAGTRLFGQELAVWRDAAGTAHVWEDRCPHRGMRLSFGFVRGDRLSCLYHGWQFDAGGRCRFIPAHPALDVPASITVARHAAAERGGLVWAFCGNDPPPPPDATTPDPLPVRSLSVTVPAARLLAALELEAAGLSGPLATLRVGPDVITAAVQPLSAQEACLHLLVAADGDRAAAQARVSRWAEALRRSLEAEVFA